MCRWGRRPHLMDGITSASLSSSCALCSLQVDAAHGAWFTLSGVHPAVARGAQLLKSLRPQVEALWGAINQRGILLPAVFVFLWQVCALCHAVPAYAVHAVMLLFSLAWTSNSLRR